MNVFQFWNIQAEVIQTYTDRYCVPNTSSPHPGSKLFGTQKTYIYNIYIKPLRWLRMYELVTTKADLTHWGRLTHICVSKLTIIGSDNGLSPERRQAIIWTNAWILLIGPVGTNFSEILIEILTFSFTKMSVKVSSAKWRPFCLGLNVLRC